MNIDKTVVKKSDLSKNFIRKPIILSLQAIRIILTGSLIISRNVWATLIRVRMREFGAKECMKAQ